VANRGALKEEGRAYKAGKFLVHTGNGARQRLISRANGFVQDSSADAETDRHPWLSHQSPMAGD